MNRYSLVLWGTGRRAKKCLEEGYLKDHKIIGFVDSYKQAKKFHGYPVYEPNSLNTLMIKADYLVITNQFFNEILKQCMDFNIDLSRIILTTNVSGAFFSNCFTKLQEISERFYQDVIVEEYRIIHTNLSDTVDNERLLGKGKYKSNRTNTDYMVDYFRFRTFEFVARELKERNIPGELAELGVFRGMFSSLINEKFPNKKLYLFDTFEGFNEQEFKEEQQKNRCGQGDAFFDVHKETSVKIMLSNMPHPESCIIFKGLFPNTITPSVEKERFSFVSIDVDFEESTYQGLKFFYPRLSDNGYIFIHDYTTHYLEGVKEAVMRYEKDSQILLKKVPLADRGGTLVITK